MTCLERDFVSTWMKRNSDNKVCTFSIDYFSVVCASRSLRLLQPFSTSTLFYMASLVLAFQYSALYSFFVATGHFMTLLSIMQHLFTTWRISHSSLHLGLYFQYILSDFNLSSNLAASKATVLILVFRTNLWHLHRQYCLGSKVTFSFSEYCLASGVTLRRIALHNLSYHLKHRGHILAGLFWINWGAL